MNTADKKAVEMILHLQQRIDAMTHEIKRLGEDIVLGDEAATYKSNDELADLRHKEVDLRKRRGGLLLDLDGLKRDLGICVYK